MKSRVTLSATRWRAVGVPLALAIFLVSEVVATASAQEWTLRVLYTFEGGNDGANPCASLVRDEAGNLYGTTQAGGGVGGCSSSIGAGCGTVFMLDRAGKETVLYSFTGTGGDGAYPTYAGLVRDVAGSLYGTTYGGGGARCSGTYGAGCGTVFKLDKTGKETVLYSFTGGADGANPIAALLLDAAGNLYGTTLHGGIAGCNDTAGAGCGTVFKLDDTGNEAVLYSFTGGSDEGEPDSPLVLDPAGNLYGTAKGVWPTLLGTVFKLDETGKQTVLHAFTGGADGAAPFPGALLRDAAGNLYGTTNYGGDTSCDAGCGVVFKLDESGNETVLHYFVQNGVDGFYVYAGLVPDAAGNLYGVAPRGGTSNQGIVFKLDRSGAETVLYSFTGGSDGAWPAATLIRDSRGNLYGITSSGGAYDVGTVFKLIPPLDIGVSPSMLIFPPQALFTTGPPRAATLSNQGVGVRITSIIVTGGFAQTNDCPDVMDSESSCTLDVTFTPTATGFREGRMTISYTDYEHGQSGALIVTLFGFGGTL
jgi:uncharacterized repeat protein (TIGR03803 family)